MKKLTKKKVPLFKVHMPKTAMNPLQKVIFSGVINEGLQVAKFENKLKKLINNRLIIATNSCTSSLTLALKIAGVGPGSEVITTPMTCIATNTPIRNLFAKPVWCDIDPLTGNIDADKIENKLSEKTKAILFVDWIGIPADLDKIKSIGEKNKIKIVEDCAQAFGAIYKKKEVGNISDFTCFSFQAIKHINTGDGGALSFLDPQDYEKGRKLKWFGIDREATINTAGDWRGARWDCDIEEAGFKYNMNNITATIGLEQLKHRNKILRCHRKNAEYFIKNLKDIPGITLPEIQNDTLPAWWVFMFFAERRDDLARKLIGQGITASLLHVRNDIYECFKDSKTELPGVTRFQDTELCIPCGWWVKEEDTKYIVDVIKRGW